MIDRRVLPPLLAFTALLGACSKPAVESYRVPKEAVAQEATTNPPHAHGASGTNPPMAPSGNAMANTAVSTAPGSGLTWKAPANWTQKTGSAMRKGSYSIKSDGMAGEIDLSITAFPGDVGGDLANINRWRGQLNLPPITQAQLETTTQHVDVNDLHLTVAEMAGTGANAERILAAIIPHAGSTWFVKAQGPDTLVAKEKPAFTAFLQTIKPGASAK